MNRTYSFFLSLALAALCLTSGLLLIYNGSRSGRTERIADQILRFHVIANSDAPEDQALKLLVKEALLEILHGADVQSAAEMARYAAAHQADLIHTAEAIVRANGYHYTVQMELGETYFPTKAYGDLTFPCGDYLALRVILGEGTGQNWWCVLYPPLCFTDVTTGFVPDETKEELNQLLRDEDYRALTDEPVRFRFWFFDAMRRLFE